MLATMLIITFTLLTAFTIWLIGHAIFQKSLQPVSTPMPIEASGPLAGFAERLSSAIQCVTVSSDIRPSDPGEFAKLSSLLENSYPIIFKEAKVTTIGDFSKLIVLQGSEPNKLPVLLTAHMDVVPAEELGLDAWKHPPFSGKIVDGYIYGRGTLDDKCSLLGILEALEAMLQEGFKPSRSVYLALGDDEEIGGPNGAAQIAAHLRNNNTTFHCILDEGGILTHGIVPGIKHKPVALVGTSEKGHCTIELTCTIPGGHASIPEKATSIAKITRAIQQIQKTPFPRRLSTPIKGFLRYLGPELPFLQRLAFANAGIFRSFILHKYDQNAPSRALIQTTVVPTQINAGIKANIIPATASATLNVRILPGESVQSVIQRIAAVIDDPDVQLTQQGTANDPTVVSSENTPPFKALVSTIKQVFPDALVAPYLTLATTDVRHYEGLSKNMYRFLPVCLNREDLTRIHGVNERIQIDDYRKAIIFYQAFVLHLCR